MAEPCKARTRSQDFGASYASTSWSCSNKASTTYDGKPVCKTHYNMLVRDHGPEKCPYVGLSGFRCGRPMPCELHHPKES